VDKIVPVFFSPFDILIFIVIIFSLSNKTDSSSAGEQLDRDSL